MSHRAPLRIIIKHRRHHSIEGGGKYSMTFKQGEYLSTAKDPSKYHDGPPAGPRVGRVFGQLPHGIPVHPTDWKANAEALMIGADVRGRCESVEWLISAEVPHGWTRAEVDAELDKVAVRFMAHWWGGKNGKPASPYLAVRHNDRPHSHIHILTVNSDSAGRAIQLSRTDLFKMKKDVHEWSGGLAFSGWGRAKKAERVLASMTREQVEKEASGGRLVILEMPDPPDYEPVSRPRRTGTLRWWPWWQPMAEVIRVWKLNEFARTPDDWSALRLMVLRTRWERRQALIDYNMRLRERVKSASPAEAIAEKARLAAEKFGSAGQGCAGLMR